MFRVSTSLRLTCILLEDYHDLHKYSVTDWTFWQDLWEYLGVIYSVPPEKVGYTYCSDIEDVLRVHFNA